MGVMNAGHCWNIQTVFDNQRRAKREPQGTKWKVFSRRPGQLERSPRRCRHDNTLKSRGVWEIKATSIPRYSSQLWSRLTVLSVVVFFPLVFLRVGLPLPSPSLPLHPTNFLSDLFPDCPPPPPPLLL